MRIESIEFVEVVVPARSGAINSRTRDKPLHKMSVGAAGAWSLQFDQLSKHMLLARCTDGTIGLGETLRGADPAILAQMAETFIGADVERLAWQALPFAKVREYDAFELLALDLAGKFTHLPASTLLGGALRDRVHVGGWSGHRTPEDAAVLARDARSLGLDCLKLKCDLDDDLPAIAAAVRDTCGPAMQLIFDPNERFEELRHAVRIAKALEQSGNVLCLEDPLPRWDLDSYRELRSRTTIPIAVHVALGYTTHGQRLEDVATAFRAGAADVYNLSAGVYDFLRMSHVADAVHRPYWHGSEIDLGVMEAGYVHAAAAARGCVLPSDIFGQRIREHDLLARPLALDADSVIVPDGPGLGVTIDENALARYEVGRFVIR